MLWYLHLCADNKIVVTDYVDHALGIMEENADGSGQFCKVTLQPRVTVATQGMIERAISLHTQAHKLCFIARSVNFPVEHAAETVCLEDE
jgi:organic hydroperoxide reductase OsmC/OhrA